MGDPLAAEDYPPRHSAVRGEAVVGIQPCWIAGGHVSRREMLKARFMSHGDREKEK